MTETKRIQSNIANLLKKFFKKVETEWNAAKNSKDGYTRKLYCPRLDIAVGPFNIDGKGDEDREKILKELELKDRLIKKLREEGSCLEYHMNYNYNPRCTIAIEIEATGSRKHMLGDITNASILGGVGIIVAIGEEKYKQFIKMKDYIDFAIRNEKIKPIFNNIIIIEANDFIKILKS